MLKRVFNPTLVYHVVLYLRMSSEHQNKRSPEQQKQEIEKRLKALGYSWITLRIYIDEAKSGRYLRKRSGYQQMLREIKSGAIAVDLILVDTIERFGRVEELPVIRKELFERHGVLVLTADTNFADPNTPEGKALGMVETMRATEHGRILGHNVLRGKRDAALQKQWPGGPTPFGLMLKSVMIVVSGREEVDHRILVPDPETSWIIVLLFETAARTGWGTTRLARFLNDHHDIPDHLKPFQPESIGYWLDNEICYGELVWEKNCTGIVDDMRVVEPNAPKDMLRVPDFCNALVTHELWLQVQSLRECRRRHQKNADTAKAGGTEKQIEAPAPGMTLNYLLSGLIYCAECGLRMTASSTAKYVTKAGKERRYVSYVCPSYLAGHCANHVHVPEEWLRTVVVDKIRERLFPGNVESIDD